MKNVEDLLRSLFMVASMVEARDPYTGGHLWRVSQFSRLLATDCGLSRSIIARVSLGGFLHDLGKVGVPDAVLTKRGRLTEEEQAVMRTHPEVGTRILQQHPLANLVFAAVRHHHETPDGRGYPSGLVGPQIPVEARIVGVCDTFDAMTSTRPYRRGMPVDQSVSIIRKNLGTQFDGELGSRLVAMVEAGQLDEIIGHTEPGITLQQCPICGPTITVMRHHHQGDLVYCRSCGAEAKVQRVDNEISITATGKRGSPEALAAEVDTALIDDLSAESVRLLDDQQAPAGLLAGRLKKWFTARLEVKSARGS